MNPRIETADEVKRPRSRRANGEGSIYLGADGYWHGLVTLGIKDDGRTDRRHRMGKMRQEVVDKIKALEQEAAAGRVPALGKGSTFEVHLNYCLDVAWPNAGLTESTQAGYRTLIERHIRPGLGAHRLDKLNQEHLQRFYAKLRGIGLAPSTVLKAHRVISSALKIAEQHDLVNRNVASKVTMGRPEQEERAALTGEQARAVLDAAGKEPRTLARWAFALEVGARQGEALGLEWSDLSIDLDAGSGVVTIRRQLRRSTARHGCGEPVGTEQVRHRGKLITRGIYPCGKKQPIRCPNAIGGGLIIRKRPKNKRVRRVAISPALIVALEYHRELQAAEREIAGSYWSDDPTFGDLVFRQPNGRPIDPRADYAAWTQLLVSAGIQAAGTHAARHTAATLLLEAGVQARVVADTLGHSTTKLLDVYAHVLPTMSAAASRRIEGVLWK